MAAASAKLALAAEDGGELGVTTAEPRRPGAPKGLCKRALLTMGPGLMVCFADTDGSCLLTAADSGSKWDYKLLLLQVVLIPTLYFAQELTVRIALGRGK